MATWDPERYLRFADERGRPFVELIGRVPGRPSTIVDLGCGPGQLTRVLRARWPGARVLGVDSSPEMIARARADSDDPLASYELADAASWRPDAPVDLIVSNAMFQRVPGALEVIRTLLPHVAPGGAFALQVPHNFHMPSHELLHAIASREPYAAHTAGLHEARGTGVEAYLELFAGEGWSVDAWETTYFHVLDPEGRFGDDAVLAWVSGTGLRPVLDTLADTPELQQAFLDEYAATLRQAYPRRRWGTLLPFRRIFAVAHKASPA